MKKVLAFLGVVFGTALMFAATSGLVAAIFGLSYLEVARCPVNILITGLCISLPLGIQLGISIDESDL
jgi:hypothetical protein